jgi:hypothetical protein
MNRRSRGTAVLALAAIAVLALAGSSGAHKRLYNASLSLGLNRVAGTDTASGQLSSVPQCMGGRVVTVFEDVNPTAVFDFQAIGKATTDASGAWSLAIQGGIKKGDAYFARTSKVRLVVNRRHKHVCKGAYSGQVVGS